MAKIGETPYGKNSVRFMRVRRDGDCYSVAELKVDVRLQLATNKDYTQGDNSDVVATDSMKNTVHILAKQNMVDSPEQFGLLLCSHFLSTYKQVIESSVYIEQAPWQRIKQCGAEHPHAFILEHSALRFCSVSQKKGDKPVVCGGLRDMKVFKATQSGFEGFVRDQYTSLPETKDRAFCTKVYANYQFGKDVYGVDFNGTWVAVQSAILDVFAGSPQTGTYSPSVQNTMYEMAKLVFIRLPYIQSIELHLPNIHYFKADLSKFNVPSSAGELLLPSDDPHGMITATFTRPPVSKL